MWVRRCVERVVVFVGGAVLEVGRSTAMAAKIDGGNGIWMSCCRLIVAKEVGRTQRADGPR